MQTRRLNDLKDGESAFIIECNDHHFSCSFLTLGVMPKAKVKVVRRAPLGGALYLKIGRHQIAIRKEEALKIVVE